MEDLVRIHTFNYRHEAELVRSILEANGIDCVIAADDVGGKGIGIQLIGGVRLFVGSDDAAAATELIGRGVG